LQMTEGVIISENGEVVTKQILPKFLRHCPFDCKQFKLHGAVVLHIPLCRSKTSTGKRHWPHFALMVLCENSTKAPMAGIYLQDEGLPKVGICQHWSRNKSLL